MTQDLRKISGSKWNDGHLLRQTTIQSQHRNKLNHEKRDNAESV